MFFKNQRIGKYKILDTIGTGGFGSVYLALDELIQKKVAIKVPHKQGENVEKMLQEPRLLAALDHPNIVSVLTAETTNDVFYIVMEYVDGMSLEAYLRKNRPLQLDQALDWFIQIGDAIDYAHSKNILHRDIRPANVLLSHDGHIKLADLGTSRVLENPFASTRIGSPPYMAPEHFQGKATFQSDIYSFGILMYESLTGQLPFWDKNPGKLAQLARETQATPVHHLNRSVPHELSLVVIKAMHRSLGSRYQRARDVVTELKKIQRIDKPVVTTASTQDLSFVLEQEPQKTSSPQRPLSRILSDLFCWNCSKPVQRRTRNCPHCNVSLK